MRVSVESRNMPKDFSAECLMTKFKVDLHDRRLNLGWCECFLIPQRYILETVKDSIVNQRMIVRRGSLAFQLFLAERCNFIAMSGYCHDMLSVFCLSVVM